MVLAVLYAPRDHFVLVGGWAGGGTALFLALTHKRRIPPSKLTGTSECEGAGCPIQNPIRRGTVS